ncbi:MAG: HupE/UreJ family protein [Gemmobacter sp.]|uniref:HupE/UreJ family protein n=1 Tax=Gemmobacter sp. TaxID=1898957 RepID=UPI00391A1888
MSRILFPALLLLAVPAFAHTGQGDHGHFLSGVLHPLTGADHMLAMVAVGLWAALAGGRAVWAMPLTFVAAMLAGGSMGSGGAELALTEPAILASLILIGAAAAAVARLPLAAAMALLVPFGLAHGYAHGAEGPGGIGYAAGFMLATLALHVVGLVFGKAMPLLARIGGGGVALAGAVLALA